MSERTLEWIFYDCWGGVALQATYDDSSLISLTVMEPLRVIRRSVLSTIITPHGLYTFGESFEGDYCSEWMTMWRAKDEESHPSFVGQLPMRLVVRRIG